ncbi:MAG: ABC transporter ATP-binding protein [Streptococcaceae bacterium]|jgi:ABC-type multidrug transport system ATPase subunit|nr:ABC transporter ATP-binding protein [Streptococcaceae bacterium]
MIIINKLFKKYEDIVFKRLSIVIPENTISFFVGRNGAGKTTLMEIIMGLNEYQEGEIIIDKENIKIPYSNEIRQKINFLPVENIAIAYLTARENLEYYACLYKIGSSQSKIDELILEYQLDEQEKKYVKYYSTGMKKRLDLAIFELTQAKILLLDEPSVGLDVYNVDFLKKKLIDYKRKNKTVIVTSHDMSLCQKIADNVFLFKDKSVIKYDGQDVDAEKLVLDTYKRN